MILGIDSTTQFLHLALVGGGLSISQRHPVGPGKSVSGTLMPAVETLLSECSLSPHDLRGVMVCLGPGGFTSLRIGVATAEGLALTGLPTWGFSAFELRAQALRLGGVTGPVDLLLDGQRGETFHQAWEETALSPAEKRPLAEIVHWLSDRPWWAPEEFRPRVQEFLERPAVLLTEEGRATGLALEALCRSASSRPCESPLVPFYLRETDAEVNFPEASRHLPQALRRGIAR